MTTQLGFLAYSSEPQPQTEFWPACVPWPDVRRQAARIALGAALVALGIVAVGMVAFWHPTPTRDTIAPVIAATVPTVDPTLVMPPDVVRELTGDPLFVVLMQRDQTLTLDEPAVAIAAAHRICGYLAGGHTTDQAVAAVVEGGHMANGDAIPPDTARVMVTSSEQAYCPQNN